MPSFGFKAKPEAERAFCKEECTMPSFGFKAKPIVCAIRTNTECTMPSFGFKAKPGNIPTDAGASLLLSGRDGLVDGGMLLPREGVTVTANQSRGDGGESCASDVLF